MASRRSWQRRLALWALVAVPAVLIFVSWPRLLAELEYLKIVRQDDVAVANAFDRLEGLGAPAQPVLLRLLHDPQKVNRQLAADSLRGARSAEAVSALMDAARQDPEAEVRLAAIGSLAHIGDTRALPLLKELGWRNTYAMSALLRMGVGGKAALLEYFDHGRTADHRALALGTLCGSRLRNEPEVREATRRGLGDESPEVRATAAECLATTSGRGGVPALQRLLEDGNPEVRIRAARELGKLGSKAGAEPLRKILLDPSSPERTRIEAALALGHLGDAELAEFLRDVVRRDPSLGVRRAAYNSLQRLFPVGDPQFESYRESLFPTARASRAPPSQ